MFQAIISNTYLQDTCFSCSINHIFEGLSQLRTYGEKIILDVYRERHLHIAFNMIRYYRFHFYDAAAARAWRDFDFYNDLTRSKYRPHNISEEDRRQLISLYPSVMSYHRRS